MRFVGPYREKVLDKRISSEEFMRDMMNDFELFCDVCLQIQTKEGTLQPFRFNAAQQILHREVEDQLRRVGYVRKILLKARQFGGTTYIAARLYRGCGWSANQHGQVIAHTTEAT